MIKRLKILAKIREQVDVIDPPKFGSRGRGIRREDILPPVPIE
jgi:hypothetical protein